MQESYNEIIKNIDNLYEKLSIQYGEKGDLKSLNILCIRLVFILYLKDKERNLFNEYIADVAADKLNDSLSELFDILKNKFNISLFTDNIHIPKLTNEIKDILLNEIKFDWNNMNLTIFGSIFESILSPEERRSGGIHYTSVENIHKVIDPLFLNDLKEELENLEFNEEAVEAFHNKISSLTFFDPACGSGNFLVETYIWLKTIEETVISMKKILSMDDKERVSLNQFYGIEINETAAIVANMTLCIAELRMSNLITNANIVNGNALQLDWNDITGNKKVNYIMGNPPFIGYSNRTKEQTADQTRIFKKVKSGKKLDFVCCWLKLTAQYMEGNTCRAAFVTTNSITQGEQVPILWRDLMENENIRIDFCWRSFAWETGFDNEASVWCVIIGFSKNGTNPNKPFICSLDSWCPVNNINGYLVDCNNVFICDRDSSICNSPKLCLGNLLKDNGNYLFTEEQKNTFLKKEPKAEYLFKPWCGAEEFFKKRIKYCLDVNDYKYGELPLVDQRIDNVKYFRERSVRGRTKSLANTPTKFETINKPNHDYLCIPRLSSSYRKYIPIGFLSSNIMPSYRIKVIECAKLYHFGILTSSIHMKWVSTICGRLKNDYSYSALVYNNFPWPTPTKKQKQRIEKTAQHILDIRNKYKDKTYKYLYDPNTMPYDLLLAHERNDKAVMDAYNIPEEYTNEQIIEKLIYLYVKKVRELNEKGNSR